MSPDLDLKSDLSPFLEDLDFDLQFEDLNLGLMTLAGLEWFVTLVTVSY